MNKYIVYNEGNSAVSLSDISKIFVDTSDGKSFSLMANLKSEDKSTTLINLLKSLEEAQKILRIIVDTPETTFIDDYVD